MATSNRIAGTVFLSVDGTQYQLAGDFEYSASNVTRETMVGQTGVDGFKEMPVAPYIAGTIRDSGGLAVGAFNSMTAVTLVAELANGKVVIGSSMWTVETQSVKTTEGTFEVRWEGRQGAVLEQTTT